VQSTLFQGVEGEMGIMFERILVPLDGSPLAECVLPHAIAIASAFESEVTLLRVSEQPASIGRSLFPDLAQWRFGEVEAKAYLGEWTDRLRATGLRTTNALLDGRAAGRIIEFAHEHNSSLILLSSHGQSGLSEWNISSVVQKIILRAHKPVMIIRAYQPVASSLTDLHYQRVLAPLDCSQRAECVLPLAATLTRAQGAELLLAHVVSSPVVPHRAPLAQDVAELVHQITEHNRMEATKYLEELQAHLSPNIQTRLFISDNAPATLHELIAQENVDLVILSAHGHSSGTRWPYGSMVLNFIAYGTTPLLIVQDLSKDEIEQTQAEMAAKEYKGH
jgi:nucleotide-binding universal stress UspA family protein